MKKRILSALLAGVTALSMAACGSTTTSSSSSASSEASEETAEAAESTSSGDTIKIGTIAPKTGSYAVNHRKQVIRRTLL